MASSSGEDSIEKIVMYSESRRCSSLKSISSLPIRRLGWEEKIGLSVICAISVCLISIWGIVMGISSFIQ